MRTPVAIVLLLTSVIAVNAEEADFIVDAKTYSCVVENLAAYLSRYSDESVIPVGRCPVIPDKNDPIGETIADGPRLTIVTDKFDSVVYAGPKELQCWFKKSQSDFISASLYLDACVVKFER